MTRLLAHLDIKCQVRHIYHLVLFVVVRGVVCKTLHCFLLLCNTGTLGTNLCRNVHWMVLYTVYVSFVDQKYTKKRDFKKVVSIYMGINYLLFSCFYGDFLNALINTIPFRNMHNVIM